MTITTSPPELDLRELALERTENSMAPSSPRKPLLSRYIIPGGILTGFVFLLIAAFSDQFLFRQEVTVVPVLVRRAEVQQAGTPLFQAAGWIEPRPTAINVAALTEGVVEELLVVEGQAVEQGEPVARLIETDAQLALRQAEAALQLQKSEQESAQAELQAAELRVKHPVHLDAALADAESSLAKAQTALAQLPHLITSAEARALYAKQNYTGKLAGQGAIAGRLIQQALSEQTDAQSQLAELKQRKPYLEKEIQTLQDKVTALKAQRELLIEENRQLGTARAKLQAANSRVIDSQYLVEKAMLALERTVVKSPINGRILSLVATPGSRVMGLESTAGQNSSTVLTMYDPARLQIRADVRLEDVPLVQPGQPVEIQTASSSKPIQGTVLLPTSTANIQKNTLEVKVAIDDPPAEVRPEMLVTATFQAPRLAATEGEISQEYERILIPRKLVITTPEGTAVWLATAGKTALLQPVSLGKAGTEDLVEVAQGLNPTSKLIAGGQEGLKSGVAITITGEAP